MTAGKLVVEPIDVPRDKMTGLRRAGGRYLADKRKLSLPLRYFKLDEGDNLLAPVPSSWRSWRNEGRDR